MNKPMTILQCWVFIAATALLLAIIASGCRTLNSKPRYDFPSWAQAECHGALNEAIAIIERVGVHKIKLKDLRVQVIPGQQKFRDGWGWQSNGDWVGGQTHPPGRWIQIVCDPNRIGDPTALSIPSLIHEMIHALLMSAGHGGDHLAEYDGIVPGWRQARKIIGRRRQ